MDIDAGTRERAADALRAFALDEDLKSRVMSDPAAAALARRIARRYTAGESVDDALALSAEVIDGGHRSSIEFVGESVRDRDVAEQAANELVGLARRLHGSASDTTLSFDLSHVGAIIEPRYGFDNAIRVARAAHDAGTSIMISAEGSDRTDLVLDLYERIADRYPATGITLQARLHRTADDLERVLRGPGPIRLVKGAFAEPLERAEARDSPLLADAYVRLARRAVTSGHRVNIATHDADLIGCLTRELGDELRGPQVEFEMLFGLGTSLLDSLRDEGYATREYITYGGEWWLYVLNRLAEHPERLIAAVADLGSDADRSSRAAQRDRV